MAGRLSSDVTGVFQMVAIETTVAECGIAEVDVVG